MSQITMLSAKNVHKILQVSHAKAYEIIRSLNAELKEKGFSVVDIGNRVGHKSSEITINSKK